MSNLRLQGLRKLIITLAAIAGLTLVAIFTQADTDSVIMAIVAVAGGHQAAQTYLDRKKGV